MQVIENIQTKFSDIWIWDKGLTLLHNESTELRIVTELHRITDEPQPPAEDETQPTKPNKEEKTEEEKRKETELDKYWKAVKDNPMDFTGWTYLLQYVEQEVSF